MVFTIEKYNWNWKSYNKGFDELARLNLTPNKIPLEIWNYDFLVFPFVIENL